MKTSPVLYPKSYPATGEYANSTHVLFGNANKGAYINPYADMVRGYKESNNLLVAAQAELKQNWILLPRIDARVLVSTTRSSYSDLTRAINPYYYQANYDKTNNSYTLTNIVEGEEYLSYDQGAKNINTTNYIEAAVSYGRTFGAHATSGMLVYTRREEKDQAKRPCNNHCHVETRELPDVSLMLMIQGILQNSTSDTMVPNVLPPMSVTAFSLLSALVISFLMRISGYRYEIQWTN